jgi:hypothetical protein
MTEKMQDYKAKYEALVPAQPKHQRAYKFQQPDYVPEPELGADGKRLIEHWGSDEADALRVRL